MKSWWKPVEVAPETEDLATVLHHLLIKLIKAVSSAVFVMPLTDLAKLDIPLLSPENFAMMDIAYYTHEHHVKQGDVVESVAAHYDPGILSFNVLSNQPGLQFQDHHQNWVDVPVSNNIGVIWAGEFAAKITEGRIKPGWHRVLCNRSNPVRMSIWIEACTKQQDLASSMQVLENITIKEEKPAQILSVRTGKVTKKKRKKSGSNDPVKSLTVRRGQTLSTALRQASRKYGVPMTKLITYYCPFCLENVHSLDKHAKENHLEAITFETGVMPIDWDGIKKKF